MTAGIDETAIGDVRAGQPAGISVDAYPGVTFAGTVQEIHTATAPPGQVAGIPGPLMMAPRAGYGDGPRDTRRRVERPAPLSGTTA